MYKRPSCNFIPVCSKLKTSNIKKQLPRGQGCYKNRPRSVLLVHSVFSRVDNLRLVVSFFNPRPPMVLSNYIPNFLPSGSISARPGVYFPPIPRHTADPLAPKIPAAECHELRDVLTRIGPDVKYATICTRNKGKTRNKKAKKGKGDMFVC